jgi:RNA polymerase sigma-70 factor (ECF subfamily)
MNDEELLVLLKTDPDAGMAKVIRLYAGLVSGIVRSRLSEHCTSSEIEDCVTDVFIGFHSGIRSFIPKTSVKNYLAVIARNTAGMYLRNRLKTVPLDEGFILDLPDEHDVGEEVEKKRLLDAVFRALSAIGHPDSDILIRKYYFGQSSKRIAASLKMSVTNVDTRSHRALKRLKEMLEEEE